jgi:uncharacterized membrane protein
MSALSCKKLKRRIDKELILQSIAAAEQQTSGEIRVSVSPFFWGNVRKVADKAFIRLGMHATRERNGILFFIVPSRRRFVVLGDEGIHQKVGQEFWEKLVAVMSENFKRGDFSAGLQKGIAQAGRSLAEHFPYQGEKDVNELPDDIDFGK